MRGGAERSARTIHGLVGENGAGKSTAMKILYGMYRPDAGEIFIRGRPCVWNSPLDALAAGIGMVHQHFMLAGPCSALDNILVGAEPVRWGVIRREQARVRLEALARQYGLAVDLDRPVEEEPVGVQQRIELLKLLYRDADILILDEPTGVLTPQETSDLFANLRKLRTRARPFSWSRITQGGDGLTERVTFFEPQGGGRNGDRPDQRSGIGQSHGGQKSGLENRGARGPPGFRTGD